MGLAQNKPSAASQEVDFLADYENLAGIPLAGPEHLKTLPRQIDRICETVRPSQREKFNVV